MDDPDVKLDGYVLPDGDPVLVIGNQYFRFCNGSEPFDQAEIYNLASKLVGAIIDYKNK